MSLNWSYLTYWQAGPDRVSDSSGVGVHHQGGDGEVTVSPQWIGHAGTLGRVGVQRVLMMKW